MNITEVQKFNAINSTPVCRHFTQPKHSVRNMEFSIVQWMGEENNPDSSTKHKRTELFSSGPSPPYTQWISIYLCEFKPSYGTLNPGAPSLIQSVTSSPYWALYYMYQSVFTHLEVHLLLMTLSISIKSSNNTLMALLSLIMKKSKVTMNLIHH